MNRRRNLPSRRQWALRLGLLAALLMLLTGVISVVLPLHHLTPGQVREAAARRQEAVETQPIASRRFQELSWQLSANDQLLLLSPYRFGFRDGWETDGSSAPAADRTQAEGPICCLGLSVTDSDGIYVQVAGLVSLEPAVAARITLPARQPGGPPVTADVDILSDRHGQRYFWLCRQAGAKESFDLSRASITLLDAGGHPLAATGLPPENQSHFSLSHDASRTAVSK